jgi:hypothetical protein
MRRTVLSLVVIVALAVPAVAFAGSFDRTFTMAKGRTRHTFTIGLSKTGTVRAHLHYSDITNPHARFVVMLRKISWARGVVIVDTGTGVNCQGAAGTIVCSGARAHTTAGTYRVRVVKPTQAAATVELKTTW